MVSNRPHDSYTQRDKPLTGSAGSGKGGVSIAVASKFDPDMRDNSTATCFPAALSEKHATQLDAAFFALTPVERLRLFRNRVGGMLVFTTSFGLEDQALTHLIAQSGIPVSFATLDTGRLFPETYGVWAATEQRYGVRIRGYYPNSDAIEALVDAQGIDGFYASRSARVACCTVRKVEPLGRALKNAIGWITGLRAEQSPLRQNAGFVSFDSERRLLKVNPLFDWTRDRVAALVAEENVPSNPLHQRGFLSIGCAPCTRAIATGVPERAGRWWWEDEQAKECGLHQAPDGRLVRRAAE